MKLQEDNDERCPPELNPFLTNISQVSSGDRWSLFLNSSGHVFSCGSGFYYNLGHGSNVDKLFPILIVAISNVIQISAPMLTSTMTINGWIQKYDGKTVNPVVLHEMEWDLMGCAARITKTNQYVLRNGSNDISMVSFQEMDLKLKGCNVNKLNPDGKKDPIPMSDLLQTFKQSILYATTYFVPMHGNKVDKTGDRHFNHFTGFKYKKLIKYNVDLLGTKENDKKLLGFLYQILCNSEESVYEWLLDWLAFTLQKPCELIGVAPVFISEEGAGKQTFWDFIGKLVIGPRYFVTKGIDGLLGKFNESIENKFLIVCNENAIKDSHMDELKPNITDTPIDLRRKFSDSKEMENFGHWVFLTNRKNPFEKINQNQRRFAIVRCNDRYAGKQHEAYWDEFRATLTPDLACHFATFLLERSLEGKDIRNWPVTEYWKELLVEDTHTAEEYLFGDGFLKDFPVKKAKATELLQKTNQWLYENYDRHGTTVEKLKNSKELSNLCTKSNKFTKKTTKSAVLYERTF